MWKWLLVCLMSVSAYAQAETKVLAFAGSTRADSFNKKLVKEAAEIAEGLGAKVTVVDLKDLPMPLFDEDLEAAQGMPQNAKVLTQLMMDSDVVIIASPEYNRSLSAVLKNAIDWVSRAETSEKNQTFVNKKFVILSASPGSLGGSRGLGHLRDILVSMKGRVVTQQVSVPNAYTAFDKKGKLIDKNLHDQLVEAVKSAL